MVVIKTICDICIINGLPLHKIDGVQTYCKLDQGLGVLEGIHRIESNNDIYNFFCDYKSARVNHSKIFR